ncbi:MAG: spore germination protein YaaH [Rhodothermales bacterium]|jgi:spore germination protein YaaH
MRFLLVLLVLGGCAPEPEAQAQRVIGYHAWWMQDSWQDFDLGLYDKILFFEFAVQPDGSVSETHGWPDRWTPLIDAVHQAGGKVAPTFAILDPVLFSAVLGDPAARNRLKNTILSMVTSAEADGAHLNFEIFEPSSAAARAGFTALARDLRRELRAYRASAELTMFIPGFDYGEAYDEVALAGVADYLIVQGYDMHWLNGPTAGPVAPVSGWDGASWEGITSRFAGLDIPADKITMAVPYFGYEWPTVSAVAGASTRGEGVPITYAPVSGDLLPLIRISARQRAAQYGIKRDPVSGSPYYSYQGSGGWYQGWFEDAESMRAKYRFVNRRGLGGVAVFLLGYDGGLLEPILREEFRGR